MKKKIFQEDILKLEQKLTPEQILFLKVLQIPKLELIDNINNELEQNPALIDVENEEIQDIDELDSEELDFEKELKEIVMDDLLRFYEPEREEDKFYELPTPKSSLKDYLKQELAFLTSEDEILRIGEYIIELLNEHGFLDYEPSDIAKDLNVNVDEVIKALNLIREIEPRGFGLKGTKEYLIYQIRTNYMEPVCETIVSEFYTDFLKNDATKIAKKLKMDVEYIQENMKKIRQLRPFPTQFEFGDVEYVIPDVIVEIENDELKISINEVDFPYIYINPKYLDMLREEKDYDKETIQFVKEKVKRALLFIKSLEMRRNLFRKLIEFILNEQKDFILKGEEFKKPLRLKDVALKNNVNITTCSRILKDVYIQINSKIYNIKEFFSLPTRTKEDLSRDNIKMIIKKIISEESKPLKDSQILKKLEEMGIKITKRTVTKYRKELNIPSYNIRRRFKGEK